MNNWKENKEVGAICFEIRIPRKKNKELLREVSTKIYGNYFIMETNKNIFWFLNNSEYHHQEMRLCIIKQGLLFVVKKCLFLQKDQLGDVSKPEM